MESNILSGTLPSSWSGSVLPDLNGLYLAANNLSGKLPELWGLPEAFASLQASPPNLSGSSGLNCNRPSSLQGISLPRPACFAAQHRAQTSAGMVARACLSLCHLVCIQDLDLTDNALTGSLPAAWGSAASWQALQTLRMSANTLGGILPDTWADPEAFPSLTLLALDNNTLAGPLPVAWGELAGFTNLTVGADCCSMACLGLHNLAGICG